MHLRCFLHIEYEWFLNRSPWPIDGTLTSTTTPVQSGPGSNQRVFHASQIPRTRVSPSELLQRHILDTLFWDAIETDHLIQVRWSDLVLINNSPNFSWLSRSIEPQSEKKRKWQGRQILGRCQRPPPQKNYETCWWRWNQS